MPVRGKDKAVKRIRALAGSGVERFVGPALFAAGDLLADEAKGSIMRGSVSGKNHVPSKPGEPPNNDSQRLHDLIEVTQPKPLLVRVTSEAEYSAALEFGTSKMEARPFMRPARDKTKPEAQRLVRQGMAQFVKSTKQGASK